MNLQSNKQYITDSIKRFLEYLLPTSTAIYAFSLGFFNSFSIPTQLSLGEAAYLYSNMILKPVSQLLSPIIIDVYFARSLIALWVLGIVFTLIAKKWKLKPIFKKSYLIINSIFFSEILILILISLIVSYYPRLLDRNLSIQITKSSFFWNNGDTIAYGRSLYIVFVFISVFLPALALFFLDNIKTFFKSHAYKTMIYLFISLISILYSYHLGYEFSGNYLNFPQIRQKSSDDKMYRLIWKTSDEMYVVDCEDSVIIKGFAKDGHEFFSNYISANKHSGVCRY